MSDCARTVTYTYKSKIHAYKHIHIYKYIILEHKYIMKCPYEPLIDLYMQVILSSVIGHYSDQTDPLKVKQII